MARSKDKTIPIQCHIITAPTHKKAFLAGFRDSEGTPIGKSWLPYSRVKLEDGRSVVDMEKGKEITIALPQWLAETDKIAELIREQLLDKDADEEGEEDFRDYHDCDSNFDDDVPF